MHTATPPDRRRLAWTSGLAALWLAYAIAAAGGAGLAANLISPLLVGVVAALLAGYGARTGPARPGLFLLAAAAASWAAADLLWLAFELAGLEPESSQLLYGLYCLPNLGFAAALAWFFAVNLKRWHRLQLTLDALAVFAVVGLLAVRLILSRVDLSALSPMEVASFAVYLATDLATVVLLVLLSASLRRGAATPALRFLAAGLFLYAAVDLYYVYADYVGSYAANDAADVAYAAAFALLGFGALAVRRPRLPAGDSAAAAAAPAAPENLGIPFAAFGLLLAPAAAFAAGLIGWVDFALCGIILGCYQLLHAQVQRAVRSETRLASANELNERLETEVAARTAELRRSNAELERQAAADELTGLRNRRAFLAALDARIRSGGGPCTVFYLDIDRFKAINDLYGHAVGDRVIRALAERFVAFAGAGEPPARLGGDEFAFLRDGADPAAAAAYGAALLDLVGAPVDIPGYRFRLQAAVGVAGYPTDADAADRLLVRADIAMDEAKAARPPFRFRSFDPALAAALERRNEIELRLRAADYDKEFSLVYQPQVDLGSGGPCGAEALLRWTAPGLGAVPPAEFIPIAERTGLIAGVSAWVFRAALGRLKEWDAALPAGFTLGLNVPPSVFGQRGFFEGFRALLGEFGVADGRIDFEITEGDAMADPGFLDELFAGLRAAGVSVSIDDFGTGYSSLAYLKRFDVDTLKIAKELVDHIADEADSRLIVKAIILMARGLGLATLAEGVETPDQLAILRELGCDRVQGYLFSRPLAADAFAAFLRSPA
jgi:diguanylate cyclase (GGDEF)-like protein